MILVLDFRAISDHEANFPKAPHDVVRDLRERMKLAQPAATPGKREVRRILGHRLFEFEIGAARRQSRLQFSLRDVNQLARSWLLFFRQGAKLLEQSRELPI